MRFRFAIPLFLLAAVPSLALAAPSVTHAAVTDASTDIDATDKETAVPEYNTVVLQGLNKVTGHISKIEGPVGTVLRFGTLEIVPHRCWKSDPEEQPENAALLEISELKPGEAPEKIFLGWMFSSSPGLSGLEHPVYDINLLSCELSKDPEHTDKTPDKDKAPDKKDKPAKSQKSVPVSKTDLQPKP